MSTLTTRSASPGAMHRVLRVLTAHFFLLFALVTGCIFPVLPALATPASGTPYSWGYNYYGQLGTGNNNTTTSPVSVVTSGALGGKTITQMGAGLDFSVALCSDGTLAAWGDNYSGSLGDGTFNNSNVPVAVLTSGVLSGKTVVKISVGAFHTLALCSDGTLVSWGYNVSGQLGNGTTNKLNVPVAVLRNGALNGKTITQIAAGYSHSIVLCSDGTLVTWGYNQYGELGNGTTTNSSVPVNITGSGALSGKTVVMIGTNSFSGLALCSDGTLVSWGDNEYGQLGNNQKVNSPIPVEVVRTGVLAGKTITQLTGGFNFSVALCSDGTVATWGLNASGELGIIPPFGQFPSSLSLVPVAASISGSPVVQVATGAGHCVVLRADNSLLAWGSNSYGQLGNGSTSGGSYGPIVVPRTGALSGQLISQLATGVASSHTMALTTPNTAPVLAVNTGLSVASNAGATLLTGANLKVTDVDGNLPRFTLTALPAQGVLKYGNYTLPLGYVFTQADIDAGRISFTPSAGAVRGSDSFKFTVSDGYGGTIAETSFLINIREANSLSVTRTDDVTADDGSTSLREAIAYAATLSGTPAITFDASVFVSPQTIVLSEGPLTINHDLNIVGGSNGIAISGANSSQIFNIRSGAVAMSNLTITQGKGVGSAPNNLGGGVSNNGTLTLVGCTLANNSSSNGGALYNGVGHTANLTNCTLTDNTSDSNGGAIFNDGGAVSLSNCTVAGNSAVGGGGGVLNSGGTINVSNSLVVNNTASVGPDAYGTFTSQGFNLLGQSEGSSGFIQTGDQTGSVASPLDAKLAPLANNGGPTRTRALLAGSPAIDAGSTSLTTDQRGQGRPFGSAPDIGAYEVQNTAPLLSSVAIIPANPTTKDALTANVTASDADNDSFTITYQWFKNGVALEGETDKTLDLSKAGNGDKGDQISVTVTVNDGKEVGLTSRTSDAVAIMNAAPVVSGVTITPVSPTTNDVLSFGIATETDPDGDTLTPTYQWKKNGVALDGETSATLDVSKAGNGDKGDHISVIVTVSDGTMYSSSDSAPSIIGNTNPVVDSVSLDPADAKTDDPLTATTTASDADGDGISAYTFVWTRVRGGKSIVTRTQTNSTGSDTLATVGSVVVAGDVVTVSVTASDGTATSTSKSASVTIGNSPVALGLLRLTPTVPQTNSVLVANAQLLDADGGRSTNTYVWTRTRAGKTTEVLRETTNGSQSRLDLSKAGLGDKGDTITVTLTASDGQSTTTKSASVKVGNSLPTLSGLKLSPTTPTLGSKVTATFTARDLDVTDGVDSFKYLFLWKAGGKSLSDEKGLTVDLSKYKFLKAGDTLSLELRVGDGTAISATLKASVKIGTVTGGSAPSAGSA